MDLTVNFDALWQRVQEMGATPAPFKPEGIDWSSSTKVGKELSSSKGVEISLDDIESIGGTLLGYHGRQVVLFIPDHGPWVQTALTDGSTGKKFHIAHCETLVKMKQQHRFERYKVTNNLDGLFEIYGFDEYRQEISGQTRLNVCKNCLNYLNYQGAANSNSSRRNQIVSDFDMGTFFTTYSSVFRYMPEQLKSPERGYTKDWNAISAEARRAVNYTCQRCGVNLKNNRELVHTHHINGVKHDNSTVNLIVLCADCHRKEPMHDHMFIQHGDTMTINRLRREQNIIPNGNPNWNTVIQLADPALNGILNHAQLKGYSPPEIAFPITTSTGQIIAEVELAWPHKKYGICIEQPKNIDQLHGLGWRILEFEGGMNFFARQH